MLASRLCKLVIPITALMTSAYKQLQTKCDMAGMFCRVWEGRARLRVVDWEEDMKGGRIVGRKEGGWDIICNTSMSYAVSDGNDHSLKLL